MSRLGSTSNPLHVAIVGSGPSSFYAAEALTRSAYVTRVTIIERLPAPFGLVRYGVAPDHPKLKQPIQLYDRVAQLPNINFLGNVMVGRDVTIEELLETHHAILFACGAERSRTMELDGNDLAGIHTATEFVGWYNGHPDYRDRLFNLDHEVVSIVGQGNVAADLARMLAKPTDVLAKTDIAEHALEVLATSRIREIHVIGRRGPAQAKFTTKELRELGELTDCEVVIDCKACTLNAESEVEITCPTNTRAAGNMEVFCSWSRLRSHGRSKRIVFRFLETPVQLIGKGQLERVVLARNQLTGTAFNQQAIPTGDVKELACGLVFQSVGFEGIPIPGVPFDAKHGVFPNESGRMLGASRFYAAGWIKRGATGIIGNNRADALDTVATLLSDLGKFSGTAKAGEQGLRAIVERRGTRVVRYVDWKQIDAVEVKRGMAKGKPREKLTRVSEMLTLVS